MSMWCYQSGEWLAQPSVPFDDLGFVWGVTVVERLRTFAGRLFRAEHHLARLRRSLEIVDLDAPVICREVERASIECVERNYGQVDTGGDLNIVVVVTPGRPADRRPLVCVQAFPVPFSDWAHQYEEGVELCVSQIRQVPQSCWPAELKCRSRMHYYLADLQARKKSPRARALLLDQEGYVGETTTANVLIYRSQEGLVTPPRDRVLPGVTLGATEELAARLGIPFRERLITPDQLAAADEVLMVSPSICVLPIVCCDGRPIRDGQPGPIYRQLLDAWNALVGLDVADQARRQA
jgi:branched-subunit amino acid aminotransferase/4-amino-4-deoxychorismate lyase